jgi:hypothetical protein
MTGNSNNRLLALLGTYKPAPWRGRYSLSRLFFNFYLLVMGSFVAIAIFADFVISTAVKGITDDYTSRFMRGTIVLIEDELFRKPRSEWPRTIKAAGSEVRLQARYRRPLDAETAARTGRKARRRRTGDRRAGRHHLPPPEADAADPGRRPDLARNAIRSTGAACRSTCASAC